jgi:hypothetical protein
MANFDPLPTAIVKLGTEMRKLNVALSSLTITLKSWEDFDRLWRALSVNGLHHLPVEGASFKYAGITFSLAR